MLPAVYVCQIQYVFPASAKYYVNTKANKTKDYEFLDDSYVGMAQNFTANQSAKGVGQIPNSQR